MLLPNEVVEADSIRQKNYVYVGWPETNLTQQSEQELKWEMLVPADW